MADIHKLAQMFQELDDQLVSCMKCGMCQAVCPVFAQSGREADVSRGKIALLEGLAHEMLTDPEGVNEKLNRCLLCGTCQANCPSGVSVMDIFLKARAIMTGYFGLSPVKKAIFRGLLKNPKLFNALTGMGAKFQGLFTKPVNDMLGSSCARFNAPVVGDRHFKGLASTPPAQDRSRVGHACGQVRHQGRLLRGLRHRQDVPPRGRGHPQGPQAPRRGRVHARRPGVLRHPGPVQRRHRHL